MERSSWTRHCEDWKHEAGVWLDGKTGLLMDALHVFDGYSVIIIYKYLVSDIVTYG